MDEISVSPETQNQKLVQPLEIEEAPPQQSSNKSFLTMISLIVILLGIGSGWLLTSIPVSKNKETSSLSDTKVVKNSAGEVLEEGVKDESLFPDKTEGELQINDGKLTQEGTHILVRPGGASQTVYLTSSAADLDKFVGKQVEIWGQTNTAQKAGWLMEVGYIKVK